MSGRLHAQCGRLYEKGPSWIGEWRVYRRGATPVRKSVAIGRVSEMPEKEARRLLGKLAEMENRQAALVGKMRSSVALLDVVKSPAKADRVSRQMSGVMAELLVCVNLAARGYEVFRPINPFCGFDLLYLEGEEAVRVEVKRGNLNPSGEPLCDLSRNLGKFDVLALVLPDGSIEYRAHPLIDQNHPELCLAVAGQPMQTVVAEGGLRD